MESIKRNWLQWLIAAVAVIGIAWYMGFIPKVRAADKNKPQPVQNIFADAPVAKLSWTGLYIGGHAGYSAANAEIAGPGFSFDGLSATGVMGGVTAGADLQLPGSGLVGRIRGGYTWSDQQFSITMGGFGASARMDDGWSADAGLGVAMGTALPYVMVGYGSSKTSLAAGGATASGPRLEGMRYIAGVEWGLANFGTPVVRPTLALEYIYSDYDSIPLGGGGAKLDIDNHTGLVRLNLRFFDGYKPSK